jgi:hypothetical protein
MAKGKPEQMSLEDYKNSPKGKGNSRVRSPSKKPDKKVQGATAEMDLSEPDECKVLDCVTINSNAQYVEYNSKYIEVKYEGQTYHISARKVSK